MLIFHHRHTNAIDSRAKTPAGKVIDWKVGMSAAEQSVSVKAGEVFSFKWTGDHNVYKFPNAEAYKSCDFTKATLVSGKPFSFSLSGSGTYYYGCKVGLHCKGSQKVTVTVGGVATKPTTKKPGTLVNWPAYYFSGDARSVLRQ